MSGLFGFGVGMWVDRIVEEVRSLGLEWANDGVRNKTLEVMGGGMGNAPRASFGYRDGVDGAGDLEGWELRDVCLEGASSEYGRGGSSSSCRNSRSESKGELSLLRRKNDLEYT